MVEDAPPPAPLTGLQVLGDGPPAPAPAPEPAPAAAAPEPASALEAKPVETPAAPAATLLEAVPPPEAPKESAAVVEPPKEPEKPVEAKPEPEKPAEVKPPEEPKPAEPIVYDFTAPEGLDVKLDDAVTSRVQDELFRPNNVSAEFGRKLTEFHLAEMARYDKHLREEQQRVWQETNTNWINQVKADPILGGAGHNTAMQAVAKVRDLVIPAKERAEFNAFCKDTGAGNHPVFLRTLYRLSRFVNEPAPPPPNPKPPADIGLTDRKAGRARALYRTPPQN